MYYSGDRMFLEHEQYHGLGMDALVIVTLLEPERYCSLGMDALVTVCFGTRTIFWFGHGCSGDCMLRNTNDIMVWAWMLWSEAWTNPNSP